MSPHNMTVPQLQRCAAVEAKMARTWLDKHRNFEWWWPEGYQWAHAKEHALKMARACQRRSAMFSAEARRAMGVEE